MYASRDDAEGVIAGAVARRHRRQYTERRREDRLPKKEVGIVILADHVVRLNPSETNTGSKPYNNLVIAGA
jgi:hypothetical protein